MSAVAVGGAGGVAGGAAGEAGVAEDAVGEGAAGYVAPRGEEKGRRMEAVTSTGCVRSHARGGETSELKLRFVDVQAFETMYAI